MSAVDDWSEVRDEAWDLAPRLARKTDAAIAELEAELAALKEEALPVECGDCRYCVLRDDHIPGCDHPIGAEQAEAALAVLKDELLTAKRLNAKWMDERTEAIIRAERAEKALAGARLMPREKS